MTATEIKNACPICRGYFFEEAVKKVSTPTGPLTREDNMSIPFVGVITISIVVLLGLASFASSLSGLLSVFLWLIVLGIVVALAIMVVPLFAQS